MRTQKAKRRRDEEKRRKHPGRNFTRLRGQLGRKMVSICTLRREWSKKDGNKRQSGQKERVCAGLFL